MSTMQVRRAQARITSLTFNGLFGNAEGIFPVIDVEWQV